MLRCRSQLGWIILLSLTAGGSVTGCKTEQAMMSDRPEQPSNDALTYSVAFPPDLPPGVTTTGKIGIIPQYISQKQIRRQYSGMHRDGWQNCLFEMNQRWDLERDPCVSFQGYKWVNWGFEDGYSQCLAKIAMLEKRLGRERAQALVREAAKDLPSDVPVMAGYQGDRMYMVDKDMYPTIQPGDFLLAEMSENILRKRPVHRGGIVVFPNRNNRDRKCILRVVALPGETVEIKNNELYVNDEKLPLSRAGDSDAEDDKALAGEIFQETNEKATYRILLRPATETTSASGTANGATGRNFPKTTVPEGHWFLLGDNRNYAKDSRAFGSVPISDIIGPVRHIYTGSGSVGAEKGKR